MKAKEAIKLIEDDGWFLKETYGSHRWYKHNCNYEILNHNRKR